MGSISTASDGLSKILEQLLRYSNSTENVMRRTYGPFSLTVANAYANRICFAFSLSRHDIHRAANMKSRGVQVMFEMGGDRSCPSRRGS